MAARAIRAFLRSAVVANPEDLSDEEWAEAEIGGLLINDGLVCLRLLATGRWHL